MSTFLDDLGRELDRAAARRRRPSLARPALAAAAAAAVVLLLIAGGDEPERDAPTPAAEAEAPKAFRFPPPPAELEGVDVRFAITDDAGGIELVGTELAQAGWPVQRFPHVPRAEVPVEDLAVFYGTATMAQAEAAARALRIDRVQPAPPQLAAHGVTIVGGPKARFAGAVEAYGRSYSVLGAVGDGEATTSDGRAHVYVAGASMCVSYHHGTGCSYGDEVPLSALTSENQEGDVLDAIGLVPDGVDHVTLSTGEQVPVRDNVWVIGRTEARYADVPGIGRASI